MKKALLIVFMAVPVWAQLSVPLTVQEALYPGDPTGTTYSGSGGIARTNEPFCMGVPVADSAGITDPQTLTAGGATAGQFRTLGTWPSGHLKWVKVCGILPSLTAGGTATVTLQNGSGNFGGSNLASGSNPITISTGTATFTVKDTGYFNVLDTVTVGSTAVVATSSAQTRGLVLTGPNPTAAYPGDVTCTPQPGGSACTTLYSSANDAGSSCTIEENGPVMAALRCVGTLFDNASHPYMHYLTRLYFYKNTSYVKVVTVLRNADYSHPVDSAGNSFDTAFKGMQSYELRIAPSISGTLNYKIAVDPTAGTSGVAAGTMTGSDYAYLYQGTSALEQYNAYCTSFCANDFTSDAGYVAYKNSALLASNAETADYTGAHTPTAFWADIADASGVGMQIGVYQGAAQWEKSLEFDAGGSDVRIGISASENGNPSGGPGNGTHPVYQAWPVWSQPTEMYLNFHAGTLASPQNAFLKLQHPLLLRADRTYYNSTGVFPYPMPSVAEETAYYQAQLTAAHYADGTHPLAGNACCTADLGIQSPSNWSLIFPHVKFWPDSGPPNQEEFRWSDMQRFLRSGQSGRWLNSSQFYRMEAANSWPHADGTGSSDSTVNNFQWRNQPSGDLDGFGRPALNPFLGCGPGDGYSSCPKLQNSPYGFVNFYDNLHFHWWGITDYYFLTGDETIREAITPVKDWYMNSNTFQGGATINGQYGLAIIRGIGTEIISAAHLSDYLRALGDPDYSTVLAQGTTNYTLFLKPPGCMNGLPAGCTMPPITPPWGTSSGIDPPGISPQRGAPSGSGERGPGICSAAADNGGTGSVALRGTSSFYASLAAEGLLALRNSEGSSWSEYNNALDLAYGMSQWALSEQFRDDGNTYFFKGGGTYASDTFYNGFTYSDPFDIPYQCPNGTPVVAGVTTQYSPGGPIFDELQGTIYKYQGTFALFYIDQLVNGTLSAERTRKFNQAMDWVLAVGPSADDLGQYQFASVIQGLAEPTGYSLQDLPFTFTNLGSGKYTLTWTVPAGIQASRVPSPYRIKWSSLIIAPSTAGSYASPFGTTDGLLNYDPILTGAFGLSPTAYSTWFAANTTIEPASGAPGNSQSFTIDTGGVTGLTAQNFSLKAYVQVGSAAVATHLSVAGYPNTTTAGASHTVTVTALDTNNNVATGYVGTVRITSSDPAAALPPNYTYQASDGGIHAFSVTLKTASAGQSITATDTATNSIAGSQTGVLVNSGGSSPAANLVYVSGNKQQASTSGSAVTWSNPATTNTPGSTGYANFIYDPLSRQSYIYTVPPGSTGIYSTDLYTYNSSSHAFTRLGGYGTMGDACTLDTSTMPGDRHPGLQLFLDSVGNRIVQVGGVNQECNGNAPGPDGNARSDMYFEYLHATPSYDWHQAIPVGFPPPGFQAASSTAMMQDTTHNVYFSWGGASLLHNHWLYCPTYANPTPGTLTAAQVSVGCGSSSTDNWVEITNLSCSGSDCVDQYKIPGVSGPPGTAFGGLIYVPGIDRFIQFGGQDGNSTNSYNYTFSGQLTSSGGQPAIVWTEIGLTGNPTNEYPAGPGGWINQPEWALTPSGIYYHQAKGANAPQDWLLNPTTGTWTNLGNNGGPVADTLFTYDASTNKLVAQAGSSGTPAVIWEGSLTAALSGQPLVSPFVVEVTDATGNPVAGVPVTFALTTGSGTFTGGATQIVINTDSNGLASTTLTPGAPAGVITVTASSGTLVGSPVVFTVNGGGKCDLNGDGVVNNLDVQIAKNQALGIATCGSADLVGDGKCSVIDVQRVIDASQGGVCLVGQ